MAYENHTIDMDMTGVVRPVTYDTYSGPTSVTPQKHDQALHTSGMLMSSDVTVRAIPQGMLGGKALMQYISGELVDVTNDDLGWAALTDDQVKRLFTLFDETDADGNNVIKINQSDGTSLIAKPSNVVFGADRVRKIDITTQPDVDFGEAIRTLGFFTNLEVLSLRGCKKLSASTIRDLPVLMLHDAVEFSTPLKENIYIEHGTRSAFRSALFAPSLQKLNMGMGSITLVKPYIHGNPFQLDFDPILDFLGVPHPDECNGTVGSATFALFGRPGSKLEISQYANLPQVDNLFLCFSHPYDITIADDGCTKRDDVVSRMRSANKVYVVSPLGYTNSNADEWRSYWGLSGFANFYDLVISPFTSYTDVIKRFTEL